MSDLIKIIKSAVQALLLNLIPLCLLEILIYLWANDSGHSSSVLRLLPLNIYLFICVPSLIVLAIMGHLAVKVPLPILKRILFILSLITVLGIVLLLPSGLFMAISIPFDGNEGFAVVMGAYSLQFCGIFIVQIISVWKTHRTFFPKG